MSEGICRCFTTFFISCFKGTENVSIISIMILHCHIFREKNFFVALGSVGQCLFCFCPQNKKKSVGSGLNLGQVGLRQYNNFFLGLILNTQQKSVADLPWRCAPLSLGSIPGPSAVHAFWFAILVWTHKAKLMQIWQLQLKHMDIF